MRWWPLIAVGFACAQAETIVELDTDLEAIDRYEVIVIGMGLDPQAIEFERDLPIVSFGLRPKDGDRSRRIELRIRAFAGEEELAAERRFLDGFEGRSRVRIFVSNLCDPPDEEIELDAVETACVPLEDAGVDAGADGGDAAIEDAASEDAEPGDIGAVPEVITSFSVGSFENDPPGAMVFDGEGNLIVAGDLPTAMVLSPEVTLSSIGLNDMYVAKYSPLGELIWWRQLEGNVSTIYAAEVDPIRDTILVAGIYYDTLRYDGAVLVQNSSARSWSFLLTIAGDGGSLEAVAIPSTGSVAVRGVERDEASGRTYLTGSLDGMLQLDSCLIDARDTDGFVMALDETFACEWARAITSTSTDFLVTLTFAPPDRIYAAGYYNAELPFPETTLPALPDLNPPFNSGLVVELSAETGEPTAALGFETADVYAISSGGDRVLAGGAFGESPLVGIRSAPGVSAPFAAGALANIAVVELTPGLETIVPLEVPLVESGELTTYSIRPDSRGGWIAGGKFSNAFVPHEAEGASDPMLVIIDRDLSIQHVLPVPAPGGYYVSDVAVDEENRQFAGLGSFTLSMELAGRTLTSSGSADLFILTGRW